MVHIHETTSRQQGGDDMQIISEYNTSERVQTVGQKQITVIDKTPVFDSEADRQQVIAGVENQLYRIFCKYM